MTVTQVGFDLVITINDTGDSVRMVNYYYTPCFWFYAF